MSKDSTPPGPSRSRTFLRLALPLAGLALLAGCTSSAGGTRPADDGTGSSNPAPVTSGGSQAPSSDSSSTSTAPPALSLASTPTTKSNVNPTTPITVTATNGTLSSVRLVNADGRVVKGAMSGDKSSWKATEVLGYGKSYRLSAKASDSSGESTKSIKRSFTTLTPSNMTMPYLETIYGGPLQKGPYGVGMIPVVRFDEPITDKQAAEKALLVTTSPHVDGRWTWVNDTMARWRPQNYYKSGTKVTVTAKVYGVDVGNGVYGQADQTASFTIGRKQITQAYDIVPKVNKVKVYRDGKLIRTMNTSMGKHYGTTTSKGQYINFFTLDGAYTVLGFENPAKMCSDSYGLPPSEGGYACENIPWGTKISVDGIYLHELESTRWSQDNGYDVSHGCLNLNHDNAMWFYQNSLTGDPVIVHGAKGAPEIQLWQGGDWQLSWKQWLAGSHLNG